jgi:hypothetical protein
MKIYAIFEGTISEDKETGATCEQELVKYVYTEKTKADAKLLVLNEFHPDETRRVIEFDPEKQEPNIAEYYLSFLEDDNPNEGYTVVFGHSDKGDDKEYYEETVFCEHRSEAEIVRYNMHRQMGCSKYQFVRIGDDYINKSVVECCSIRIEKGRYE